MSYLTFQRTPLAVAVCSAVLCAPVGAASLLDDAAPTVDLYAAPAGYQLDDFEVTALPGGRFAVLPGLGFPARGADPGSGALGVMSGGAAACP